MTCIEAGDGALVPRKSVFDIYRVQNKSALKIVVPAGHPYSQLATELVVTEGDGCQHVVPMQRSAIGSASCEWKPLCSGPATLTLRCLDVCSRKVIESPPSVVLVSPQVKIRDQTLVHTSLCVCSVIAARLGPVERWSEVLKVVKRQHFNAVHLTPIQKLGESGSSYSIADQLAIAEKFNGQGWEGLHSKIQELRADYHMLFFEDLVLNHTASNSAFLRQHPEAACNEENSPWLLGAIDLDNAIKAFTQHVIKGQYRECSAHVRTEDDLARLVKCFKEQCLSPFRLEEYFWINVTENKLLIGERDTKQQIPEHKILETVWNEVVKCIGVSRSGIVLPSEVINSISTNDCNKVEKILKSMNEKLKALQQQVYASIVQSFEGTVRYERIQAQKGPVTGTPWNSFVAWYFTPIQTADGRTLHLANNGWVMDWDTRKDFTESGSLVYMKRSLLAWSDCVKLRYGAQPSDSPFLWEWMGKYCYQVASMFDGVRLDNCHSTPLHVGKYMLEQARKANPELFVFAELFTGNQETDALFELELGLDALVREAVQTSSPGDCAYHAMKFTGCPLGSLQTIEETKSICSKVLVSKRAINLFYDCTHDNETPFQKGRAQDALATAAIVCASNCAVGSTLGFEVLMRSNPSVVDDGVLYKALAVSDPLTPKQSADEVEKPKKLSLTWNGPASSVQVWSSSNNWKCGVEAKKETSSKFVCEMLLDDFQHLSQIEFKFVVDGRWTTSADYKLARDDKGNVNNVIGIGKPLTGIVDLLGGPGIVEARRALNDIHQRISEEGYNEISVQWPADDFQILERHNKLTGKSIYFFVRSHWWRGPEVPNTRDVTVAGKVLETLLCCTLNVDQRSFSKPIKSADNYLNGIADSESCLQELHPPSIHYDSAKDLSYLNFTHFPSGSVFVTSVKIERPEAAIHRAFGPNCNVLKSAVSALSLQDINYLLWSCEAEEKDRSNGARGIYAFPGLETNPVYAGFAGAISALDFVHRTPVTDHSTHPVYTNIRDGPWLVDYHGTRVAEMPQSESSRRFKALLHPVFESLRSVKQPLWRPPAVDFAFCHIYRCLIESILDRLPSALALTQDPLVWRLAVAATQVLGRVHSSSLYSNRPTATLAAGLPFFTTEYMREWGRDSFLALPGILCATGRWEEAREEILAYATLLRHSMIPNLMDSGNNPRYNARDAVWFWLYAVQQYVRCAPNGSDLLQAPITPKFDHGLKYNPPNISNIADMIHHVLSCHYTGIEFREWNAGLKIDSQMKDEGFNVGVRFDAETGMCMGGNRFNCGTWMDKMGSSEKAGNKGIPASPRDGAPVELTCALYSTLSWISNDLIPKALFPYSAAENCRGGMPLSYADWMMRIKQTFNAKYYINEAAKTRQRGAMLETYKDTYGSKSEPEDYYLRCNYSVGFAFAPDIDDADKIRRSLDIAYEELVGEAEQIGMKTLNAGNPKFRPNYDNANDSTDTEVAHGWNYHNGPEWIWPLGYWFKARWMVSDPGSLVETMYNLTSRLKNQRLWIQQAPWFSLPELVHRNGKLCVHSCQAQAWSIGAFLMFFDTISGALTEQDWGYRSISAPLIEKPISSHEPETEASASSPSHS